MRPVLIFAALALLAFMFGPTVTAYAGQTAGNLGFATVAQHATGCVGQGIVGLAVIGFSALAVVRLVRG